MQELPGLLASFSDKLRGSPFQLNDWILKTTVPVQEINSKEALTSHLDGIYIPELTGACICDIDGLTFTLPPSQPGRSESGSLAGGH